MAKLILESFFVGLGSILVISSWLLYSHFTYMPNVRPPKRLSIKPLDTVDFYLSRDSNSGLLHLSPCPPSHPLYGQALKNLYDMPDLTFDQMIYLRNLQYTFELAMGAYVVACQNEETLRLAAKFMDDMHLLASEMYAISRKLNLGMQVRFPRECDDPILTANQPKQKAMKNNPSDEKKAKPIINKKVIVLPDEGDFHSATGIENLFDFTGESIKTF